MHTPLKTFGLASLIAMAATPMISLASTNTASSEVNNARKEMQIWTTYALSPYLKASSISVAVDSGKATLTGRVAEDVNKELATQIALGVTGITDVDNRLVVQSDFVAPRNAEDRRYAQSVSDATITSSIKARLGWSQYAQGHEIAVRTTDGQVVLTGSVDSKEGALAAGRLASNTTGVTGVDNRLLVAKKSVAMTSEQGAATPTLATDIADTWITTKVKSTYLYSSNVQGSDIDVSTLRGVVTLRGDLDSSAERALAIELARNVNGVSSVETTSLAVR